jgi:cytochrome c oxidase cbb3-type subunit 3
MSDKIEKDELSGQETTGHEWDGIKELNTPLPRWWLYTFYACILFAGGYCIAYPAFPLPWGGHSTGLLHSTNRTAVDADIKSNAVANRPQYKQIAGLSIDEIQADSALKNFAIDGGRSAFATNCAPCHGSGAQGAKGYPNLLDDVWLWGGSLAEIYQTIQFGVRNANEQTRQGAAMPAWGVEARAPPQLLTGQQIEALADYLLTLNHQPVTGTPVSGGAALFAENCVACHGEKAEGNPELGAPPLTAGVWLYGGDRATLVDSITHGRAGQMPAWSERLDPAMVKMLAIYVHQLGGGR